MIILLNGPIGIGKSTLAELMSESIDHSVMINGDLLLAVNPEPKASLDYFHSTIELLVSHQQGFGYRHFILDHLWTAPEEIEDLRDRLAKYDPDFYCFLLKLPMEENLKRIQRRASVRAIDELEQELEFLEKEREILYGQTSGLLGEPFEVTDTPAVLVNRMLKIVGLR